MENQHDPIGPIAPFVIKTSVWLGFALVLYFLRSFFLLIFLTFVFAYIQAKGVARLGKYLPSRNIRVIVVALVLLGVLLCLGALIAPRVAEQTRLFVEKYPLYIDRADNEILELSKTYPILGEILPPPPQSEEELAHYSPTGQVLQQIFGVDHSRSDAAVRKTISTLRDIGTSALGIGSAFLLSLLFSFLIVFDLPSLISGARSLRDTKVKFIYDEVALSLVDFCAVLGRALEAQLFIALLNTVLTSIGLIIIGITEKMAFLLLIVFLCSFIPVAGVFLSSIPICLLALQKSGFQLLLAGVLMITVVHLIEAYILNPRIYGHHLRINPVIVLIILTISGKIMGVWGLVLGVPICTYIFGHAIRNRDNA